MTVLVHEPCAGCSAPLGADQRYCLSCGIPRSGTRLPFLDVLHAESGAAGVAHPGAQPSALLRMPALAPASSGGAGWWDGGGGGGGMAGRLRENTGLFALLGVLLLALLIGLLLGHWVSAGSGSIAAVPSRQVVEIKGLPTVAAASSAGASGAAGGETASEPSSADAAKSATHAATHASNPTVSNLAQSTGKDHAKAVEKALSNGGGSLSTGGAPPPKETGKSDAGKPIGGGSDTTTIE